MISFGKMKKKKRDIVTSDRSETSTDEGRVMQTWNADDADDWLCNQDFE